MIDQMVVTWCKILAEPTQLNWEADHRLCARWVNYFYTGQLMGVF